MGASIGGTLVEQMELKLGFNDQWSENTGTADITYRFIFQLTRPSMKKGDRCRDRSGGFCDGGAECG